MTATVSFTQTSQIPVIAFTEALAQWIARLERRGKAANTIKAYSFDLLDCIRHLARRDVHVVAVASAHDIESWVDDMAIRLKPRTQARRVTAVRRFFDYCIQQRWCTANPCIDVRIKFKVHRVTAPETADLMRVIGAIPDPPTNWMDVRDRALLRVAFDAALRAGGVSSLDTPDSKTERSVNLVQGWVRVAQKGGGTTDPIAINEATVTAVRAWLDVRPQVARPGETALFVSRRGGRMDRRTMHQVCRRRGGAVGLNGLHIHLFRHRRIGDVLEKLGVKVACAHAQHAFESTTVNVYGAHAASVTRGLIRQHADLDRLAGAPA